MRCQEKPLKSLKDLPNIGKTIEKELNGIGISSDEDLKRIGAVEALIRISKSIFDEGCLNKLYALEGAIQNIRWHSLEENRKAEIKREYYSRIGKI